MSAVLVGLAGRVAVGLLLGWTVAAAGPPATASPSPGPHEAAPGPAVRTPETLRWSADGTVLVVGDQWLLLRADERFEPLPQEASGSEPLPSPDGTRVLLLGRRSYRIWQPGRLGPAVPLPRFVGLHAPAEASLPELDVHTTGFWLDRETVYLSQSGPWSPAGCRLLALPPGESSGSLSEPTGGCLSAAGGTIVRLDSDGNGRIAIVSAVEGHPSLAFASYDADTGPGPLPGPDLLLYPSGPVAVAFAPEGRVDLSTPCLPRRSEPPPCAGADARPWRVWSWTAGGGFELLLEAGAEPVAWSPAAGCAAFVREGRLCLLPVGRTLRCLELPATPERPR